MPTKSKTTRSTGAAADARGGAENRGPIEPCVLYPLAEIQRRTGFGRHAMRQARANGLPVHYAGNRGFVLGRELIEYVTGASRETPRQDGSEQARAGAT